MSQSTCKEAGCGATIIYVEVPKADGSGMTRTPLDYRRTSAIKLDENGNVEEIYRKVHISHFLTCKNPRRFSKRRK